MEELDLFLIYEAVADWVWQTVETWPKHRRDGFGMQLTDAADSVGANLVEGDGRYGTADAIRFFVIARASARETRLWINRGARRGFIESESGAHQVEQITRATKLLNLLINYRRSKLKTIVKESRAPYRGGKNSDPFLES
jgi:four helix bundle protein